MRKASDVITALFRDRFGPEFMENARSTADLFSSWTRVVTEIWPRSFGDDRSADDIPAAAAHSRIGELEKDLLLVEADHPGWIQILQTRQKDILAAVQRRYPELGIRSIAFRLSREPFPSKTASAETGAPPKTQTESPERSRKFPEVSESPLPPRPVSRPPGPGDEEFYAAMKSLEESIKKRNNRLV